MKRAVDYDVLIEVTIPRLIHTVRAAIECGWEPIGPMQIEDDDWFCQTMVKYEDLLKC